MTNTKSTKTDCFACQTKPTLKGGSVQNEYECTALNEMDCENGRCKFYKHKMKFLHELAMQHGTTNLDMIERMYAEKKGEAMPVIE